MVLFSIKALEDRIKNRTITARQFIIYSILTLGSILSLVRTTRYPINTEAYNIANVLSIIPIIITIIQYIQCYKIIKEKDIKLFLYSIIPITFILRLRYIILLTLPLIILNTIIIRNFDLEYNYWNVINSQIISIIVSVFFSIHFIKILKRIYKDNNYNELIIKENE